MDVSPNKQPKTEEEWWNIYGNVQEQIWVYDDYFEQAVRSGYLDEMVEFLFKPGGRVLDFGCGSGWVGLRLAKKGMWLDGVDLSTEQIKFARQQASEQGIENVNFQQAGVEVFDRVGTYDGIIVHSLFHHLTEADKRILLDKMVSKLAENGKIYFYEPLAAKRGADLIGRILNKGTLGVLWLMRKIVHWLHLQKPNIHDAVNAGWKMQSPDEAPIDLDEFITLLPSDLKVVKVTCWHMAAVAYANLCMGLKLPWRKLLRPAIVIFKLWDRIILIPRYRKYMRAWPMASILLIKKG